MSQYRSELFAQLVHDLSKVGKRGVEWFRTAILLLSQKRRAAVLSVILLSFGALYGISKTLDRRVTGGRRADRSWQWNREIILITGGSRGMGELMVRGFASRNIRVAIIDQIPPQGHLPAGVKFYQADITSPQAVHDAAEQIRNDLGEPTVIINNAGIGTGQNILTTSDELIQRTFDVNTVSHFWLIREFLPAMVKRNHGHVVTIASMASFFVIAGNVDYSCSKASALAFHEGLTQELKHRYNAPNVRTTKNAERQRHTHEIGDNGNGIEVVLPDGRFVSVDENSNPDLYFALRGGGGSVYGVVTSIIYRAWPKTPITRLTYTFSRGNLTADQFWEGMDAFHAMAPAWTDAGVFSYWSVACTDTIDCTLSMAPQLAVDMSVDDLEAINAPLFSDLSALGLVVDGLNYTTFDGYLATFEDTWNPDSNTGGYWFFHTTSRMFPASNWESTEKLAAQNAALRVTAEAGRMVQIYYVKPPVIPALNQTNAVLPAWRTSLAFALSNVVYGANYTDEDIAEANKGAVEALQPWRDVSPGSGTYLNECDINEPDSQQALYGDNYPYLYELKRKYDPWGLLYAAQAVGSEDWYITGQLDYYPPQNGRLCPA